MKLLIKIFVESKKVFPYLIIIILYFFIINLEQIIGQNSFREINNIDGDLETVIRENQIVDEAKSKNSKRISIQVVPFKE